LGVWLRIGDGCNERYFTELGVVSFWGARRN
jgi:hypothetical protein